MKTRLFLLAVALVMLPFSVYGQTGHSVILTVSSPDTSSAAPGSAGILRAPGACPATGVPASGTTITPSPLSVPGTANYTDTTVTGGNTYCYWAVLNAAGGGSGVSNTFLGSITVSVSLSGTAQ